MLECYCYIIMTTKVASLMADTLQKKMDSEVNIFKPESENYRFVVSVGDTVAMVDTREKVFTPMKRSAESYMELKEFMKNVGLEYRARSK